MILSLAERGVVALESIAKSLEELLIWYKGRL